MARLRRRAAMRCAVTALAWTSVRGRAAVPQRYHGSAARLPPRVRGHRHEAARRRPSSAPVRARSRARALRGAGTPRPSRPSAWRQSPSGSGSAPTRAAGAQERAGQAFDEFDGEPGEVGAGGEEEEPRGAGAHDLAHVGEGALVDLRAQARERRAGVVGGAAGGGVVVDPGAAREIVEGGGAPVQRVAARRRCPR